MHWAIDLDGVLWRGENVIEGAPDALRRLRAAGSAVSFATNNSSMNVEGFAKKLTSLGFSASPSEVLNAGRAVGRLVKPGERVLALARDGVIEGLNEAGVAVTTADAVDWLNPTGFDAVVVAGHSEQSLSELAVAMRAVLGGARLLAPSGDPMFPGTDGMYLGGGSMTAAVAYATGVEPEFAGKPHRAMIELMQQEAPGLTGMIGDQISVDGRLAEGLGVEFIWVQSGAKGHDNERDVKLTVDVTQVDDFPAAVDLIIKRKIERSNAALQT